MLSLTLLGRVTHCKSVIHIYIRPQHPSYRKVSVFIIHLHLLPKLYIIMRGDLQHFFVDLLLYYALLSLPGGSSRVCISDNDVNLYKVAEAVPTSKTLPPVLLDMSFSPLCVQLTRTSRCYNRHNWQIRRVNTQLLSWPIRIIYDGTLEATTPYSRYSFPMGGPFRFHQFWIPELW